MARKVKRLVWDIETSPNIGYFWRPGRRVWIEPDHIIKERSVICICYKWAGEKKISSLTWDEFHDDRTMIKNFLKVANQADELIAHNGDRFDMPWFKGRCVYHKLDPTPVYTTVDTLAIVRKNFAFNSYKLDYLGKELLGLRKIKTSFDLWRKVMDGDQSALSKMVTYCKRDVDVLEKLWDRIQPYYTPKTHVGVLNGYDRWTCPHDGSSNVGHMKKRVTSAGMVRQQFRCKDCGRYYTIPNTVYCKYLEEKDG